MNEEEMRKKVRKILDNVARNGAYTAEEFVYLSKLYWNGYNDMQSEFRDLLGIE